MIKNILVAAFIFIGVAVYPQAGAYFTCKNTICFGDSLKITNTSVLNITNQWIVCTPALYKQPEVSALGILDSLSTGHTKITMASDSNYYLFLTNRYDSTITRIKFHQSWFDTVPETKVFSSSQLDNKIFSPQGIQVRYDAYTKKWYGFVVNVDTRMNMYLRGNLARLDFGTSLDSIPKVTIIDTVEYHLMFPLGMQLECDAGGKWHLFVANASNMLPLSGPEGKGFSISHYYFSDSVSALPVWNKYYAYDMGGTTALNEPQHIRLLKNPAGEWYGIILNSDSRITRVTLGYSLEYWPYVERLPVIADLSSPVDFNLFNSCNGSYGLFINGFASKGMTLIGFDSTLNNPQPATYPADTKFNYPVCMSEMYRQADSMICFAVNGDNSILRIFYKGCCDSVIGTSDEADPDPLHFSKPGVYNIRLIINKDSADEQSYCRNISVTNCKEAISKESMDINIYPTPVSDMLNVEFPGMTSGIIFIYDENGRVMLQKKIILQEKVCLPLGNLSSGLYFINISADRGTSVRKFIKQ